MTKKNQNYYLVKTITGDIVIGKTVVESDWSASKLKLHAAYLHVSRIVKGKKEVGWAGVGNENLKSSVVFILANLISLQGLRDNTELTDLIDHGPSKIIKPQVKKGLVDSNNRPLIIKDDDGETVSKDKEENNNDDKTTE